MLLNPAQFESLQWKLNGIDGFNSTTVPKSNEFFDEMRFAVTYNAKLIIESFEWKVLYKSFVKHWILNSFFEINWNFETFKACKIVIKLQRALKKG